MVRLALERHPNHDGAFGPKKFVVSCVGFLSCNPLGDTIGLQEKGAAMFTGLFFNGAVHVVDVALGPKPPWNHTLCPDDRKQLPLQ